MRKIRAVLVREVAKTKERKPEGEKPPDAGFGGPPSISLQQRTIYLQLIALVAQ